MDDRQNRPKSTDSTQAAHPWGRVFRRILKPFLVLLVILGIGQAIRLAWQDLRLTEVKTQERIVALERQLEQATGAPSRAVLQQELDGLRASRFSFHNIRWLWLATALPLAGLTLFPSGRYWWCTLQQFGHPLPWWPIFTAYVVGGLGKYVPGKAMVIVLRSAALQPHGVPLATSIVSIFIETLMTLAAAGGIGTMALATLHIPPWLRWSLIATASLSLLPLLPPFFQPCLSLLSRTKQLRLPQHLATALTWSFVGRGWLWSCLGQFLMGCCLWLVCEAIRPAELPLNHTLAQPITSWQVWMLCQAATSMGQVIGFLSMLPGGAGARELVVTLLLAPAIGYAPALAAAVIYRIVTLTAELLLALGLWWMSRLPATARPSQRKLK
jgi:uncharacterized membrane protein YbhN (UPF0104 family)